MSPARRSSRFLSRKRLRALLFGIVALSIVLVSASMLLLVWKGYHSVYIQPAVYAPPPPPIFRAARRIYPFSIIPGGVYDGRELAQSVQLDPLLAEHYRDIQIENLIAVRLQAPMNAYVSFLRDGEIHWTCRKLTIPAGELVLTDGKHMIRSRCGNRISEKRPKDAASCSAITQTTEELTVDAPLPSIVKLPPPLQPVLPTGTPVGDVWPNGEIAVTPEPGTLILFVSGLLLIILFTFPRG